MPASEIPVRPKGLPVVRRACARAAQAAAGAAVAQVGESLALLATASNVALHVSELTG